MMPSWIQDPKTGRLISREDYNRQESDAPAVHGQIDSFVSPIDGTLIDDRAKLRRHNERHGVTDSRDYSKSYYDKAKRKREENLSLDTPRHRQERVNAIQRAISEIERG